MPAFTHILVPTDFGDASGRAVTVALDLAAAFGAKVTLMHATLLPPYMVASYAQGLDWPADELEDLATKELKGAVSKAKERYANVDGALAIGDPWARILEVAKERGADLIVMGTHGRRGLSRLLIGSVAEKVVRMSPVPVLTVSTEQERKEREEALAEVERTASR